MPDVPQVAKRLRDYAAGRRQQLEFEFQQAEGHRAGRKEELDALDAFIKHLEQMPWDDA